MEIYYVDSTAESDGDGSKENPYREIRPHVNTWLPGDIAILRGSEDYEHPQPYRQPMIELKTSGARDAPITIKPYPGEAMILFEYAPGEEYHQHVFDVYGDWWTIGDPAGNLVLDKENRFNGGCVQFRGNHNVLNSLEARNVLGGWIVRNWRGYHNSVLNSKIHDGYRADDKDCHGVFVAGGGDVTIDGCEIFGVTDCVQIYDGYPVGKVSITDSTLYTKDGTKAENAIDVKAGPTDEDEFHVIRGNTMHGFRFCLEGGTGANGEAITIHMTAGRTLIENNDIFDSVVGIRAQSGLVTVRRNYIHDMVVDPASWINTGLMVSSTVRAIVHHNTVSNCPQHALHVGDRVRGVDLVNNLFSGGRVRSGANTDARYNGWFGTDGMVSGDGDSIGDDAMLDENGRLLEGSPAIGAGANGADLGAFPYIPPEQPIPPTDESLEATMDRIASEGGLPYAYRKRRLWVVGLGVETDEPSETLRKLAGDEASRGE